MAIAQRDVFLAALENVLGANPGIAVIHSSLASLAPPTPLKKWDALYAVDRLVRAGWTLVFPSFTFSFTRSGLFDREQTPSETGILADWVQNSIVGAIRTDHPIYSFVAVGPRAGDIAGCRSETTFADSSPFGLFERENATVVMLGADWTFCTPFHRYEEKAEVSYRLFKTFQGQVTCNGTTGETDAVMYVRDLELGAENDFSPLIAHMRATGNIMSAPLWRAAIEAVPIQVIRASAEALLADNPLAFVGNAAQVRYRMDMAAEAALLPAFRVAMLGSSNLDIAGHQLGDALAEWMPGRQCKIFVPPFGQLGQQVMMPGSELAEFKADLAIFADRIEDLLGQPALDLIDPETAVSAVQSYADLIVHFAQANSASIVVHRFAVTGRHNVERLSEMATLVARCNGVLQEVLAQVDGVIWVDLASEVSAGIPLWDARLWHLGRIPFSKAFTVQLTTRWGGIILALLGKTARLLVLDLDHTMWGGVLGEDGPEGIQIGGDFPGNAFSRFQHTIKALSERGIALAVCSKNDEDLALEVLKNHNAMVIRPDDLVNHRINWQPKWQNIRDIAADLDLGLGSVMFIDDNPVEREAVKRNLPMVKVLELPQDPTAYTETLLASPFLETLQTGKEDRKRVSSYKARQKINQQRSASANIEDFLRSLQMKIYVQPLDGDNIARAAQLCQKTNQFNTTTRRYSAAELEAMVAEGCDVAVIGLADKFSEQENIGLIILRPDPHERRGHVDLFLLSCRVLGRTVERAILDWAVTRSHGRGWDALQGDIIETPRNTPVRKVFADHDFEAHPGADLDTGVGSWQRAASSMPVAEWFDVQDEF